MDTNLFPADLVEVLRRQYRLDWHGVHGWMHWVRVGENGLRLAGETAADAEVVRFFALLHDCARRNEHLDPWHGARAAKLIEGFDRQLLPLDQDQRELLREACSLHTKGLTEADITVQTCWDADRLDLGRVGIRPKARFLCTEAARRPEIITWAWERSRSL